MKLVRGLIKTTCDYLCKTRIGWQHPKMDSVLLKQDSQDDAMTVPRFSHKRDLRGTQQSVRDPGPETDEGAVKLRRLEDSALCGKSGIIIQDRNKK